MRWNALTVAGLVFLLAPCGCGGGGSSTDGGYDGDGGSVDFALSIPDQTTVCSLNFVNPLDLPAAFAGKARVALKPGRVELPGGQASFERDIVDGIEAGPGAAAAVPDGPGSFTLNRSVSGGDETYAFVFSQGFQVGDQSFTFRIAVDFEVKNGTPVETTATVDEGALTRGRFRFSAEFAGSPVVLTTCQMSQFNCVVHEFDIDGGDRLKFEQCNYCPPETICKATPGNLLRALFVSGTEERDITDPFRLAHSMRHHDWGADYLILFARPVGAAAGLYLATKDYPDYNDFAEIQYLDASFQIVQTKTITSHRTKTGW